MKINKLTASAVAAAATLQCSSALSSPPKRIFDGLYIGIGAGVSENKYKISDIELVKVGNSSDITSRGFDKTFLAGYGLTKHISWLDDFMYFGGEIFFILNDTKLDRNVTSNTTLTVDVTTILPDDDGFPNPTYTEELNVGSINETNSTNITFGPTYGIRGRVGVPFKNDVMIYASLGIASADIKVKKEKTIQGSGIEYKEYSMKKYQKTYFVPGLGIQFAITPKLSARVEMIYNNIRKIGSNDDGMSFRKIETAVSLTYKVG